MGLRFVERFDALDELARQQRAQLRALEDTAWLAPRPSSTVAGVEFGMVATCDTGLCWDLAPHSADATDSVKAKIQDKCVDSAGLSGGLNVHSESGIGTSQHALAAEVANEIRHTDVVQNTIGPDMLSGGMIVRAESGIGTSQHALVVEVANEIRDTDVVQNTIGPDMVMGSCRDLAPLSFFVEPSVVPEKTNSTSTLPSTSSMAPDFGFLGKQLEEGTAFSRDSDAPEITTPVRPVEDHSLLLAQLG